MRIGQIAALNSYAGSSGSARKTNTKSSAGKSASTSSTSTTTSTTTTAAKNAASSKTSSTSTASTSDVLETLYKKLKSMEGLARSAKYTKDDTTLNKLKETFKAAQDDLKSWVESNNSMLSSLVGSSASGYNGSWGKILDSKNGMNVNDTDAMSTLRNAESAVSIARTANSVQTTYADILNSTNQNESLLSLMTGAGKQSIYQANYNFLSTVTANKISAYAQKLTNRLNGTVSSK